MRLSTGRKIAPLLACLFLIAFTTIKAAPVALPNPILIFTHYELFQSGGKQWKRYRYAVFNRSEYPDTLFSPAPALPPCGTNTKAARTWVDLYDQSGKRLNGFCALGKSSDLDSIWFALEQDKLPPSWIYIEMNDRQTNTKYKSNLAETTL